MKIPFVDLKLQYTKLKPEIDSAISKVIDGCKFIGGQKNAFTQDFEKKFASFAETKFCISCANGTDSLEILLRAMEISNGDEVLVPALSWISTSETVSMVGAKPVFVDIDETFTLDPQKIEAKITPATRAIIPVHLYGQTANMDEIMKIAKKHGLLVLEDCAQAHGSAYNGKKAGTLGDAASFSFYPGKNLGAYGDAGCMVTSEAKIEEKARMLANHGQKEKHHHLIEGKNSRMDGIQAAILSIKLKYLDEWNRKRKQHAKLYSQLIKNKNIILPEIATNRDHVFHLYVIRTPQRERLIQLLDEKGISWGIHYPFPLPLLKAYEKMGHKEADFPVAAQVCNEILSIPMYPELSDKQIEFIADTINSFKIG